MVEDDADAMQLAFERYMMSMGGSGVAAVVEETKEDEAERLAQKEAREEELRVRRVQAEVKKAEKKYWQVFQKFGRLLKDEWFDIDDQAHKVVESIAGIRRRLPMAYKVVEQLKESEANKKKNEWASHGFSQTFGGGQCVPTLLNEEDADLALSHDLLQHEKMMSSIRSLFANLSECQEAMHRILDEIMKHHHECIEVFDWSDLTVSFYKSSSLEELMNDFVAMLSLELYRKQSLVHLLLGAVEDDVLKPCETGGGKKSELDWEDLNAEEIATRCQKVWMRNCKESALDVNAMRKIQSLLNK